MPWAIEAAPDATLHDIRRSHVDPVLAAAPSRRLPVYLLLDVSSSMSGEPIRRSLDLGSGGRGGIGRCQALMNSAKSSTTVIGLG